MNIENNTVPHYIIGTRGSLLALTQCLQMKREMEDSGKATFSLKIIKTQGDENTQAPLWALDGKDFFTKELDEALLAGDVDLVVHSYKDLGSERPAGITLATITERKFAHDILFIRKEARDGLQAKRLKKFVVGTSSPRRIENLSAYLRPYLPYGDEQSIEIETKTLRGNVNTRLKKCVDGEYDAIVLALPGIERLAKGLPDNDNEAFRRHGNPQEILKELISELDYMVLPLGAFPAAASQGALAIECLEDRKDNGQLLDLLNSFNHDRTINEVAEERRIFQTYGGGCHLAVGINVSYAEAGLRTSIAGAVDENKVKQLHLKRDKELPSVNKDAKVFIGLAKVDSFTNALGDSISQKNQLEIDLPQNKYSDILITSPSVVEMAAPHYNNSNKTLSWWASGTRTMKKMASQGIWVRGCADSLGETHLKKLRMSGLLQSFDPFKAWASLSHDQASSSLGDVITAYTKSFNEPDETYRNDVASCEVYYWTSSTQYEFFKENFDLNPKAIHTCGLGKTYQYLKESKLGALPIASMRELKQWLN